MLIKVTRSNYYATGSQLRYDNKHHTPKSIKNIASKITWEEFAGHPLPKQIDCSIYKFTAKDLVKQKDLLVNPFSNSLKILFNLFQAVDHMAIEYLW